jgi:transposase
MAKHRTPSIEFKRQVVQEFLGGESPHALAKRHGISRNLIKIWVAKYEAGGLDSDTAAADVARIAALERLVGKLALENEFLKGLGKIRQRHARETRVAIGIRDRVPVGIPARDRADNLRRPIAGCLPVVGTRQGGRPSIRSDPTLGFRIFCAASGSLDEASVGIHGRLSLPPLKDRQPECRPWNAHPGRRNADRSMLVLALAPVLAAA